MFGTNRQDRPLLSVLGRTGQGLEEARGDGPQGEDTRVLAEPFFKVMMEREREMRRRRRRREREREKEDISGTTRERER
jgi:hypothetical protein